LDELGRALAETHLRSSLVAMVDLSEPWAVDFEQSVGIPVHYVVQGGAWLHMGGRDPLPLRPGDLVMFPRWDRHVMTSGEIVSCDPITISDLVIRNGRRKWMQGEWLDKPLSLVLPGPGRETQLFSMVVEVERGAADLLLLALPRLVHISSGDEDISPWLSPILQILAQEEARHSDGFAVVQSRLAELLFLQLLRSQLLLRRSDAHGWRVMLDPAIGRAVAAMRERPDYRWTLDELADIALLSRSGFASRFARVVELTPFEFLRGLRLDTAAQRLKRGDRVKAVVEDAGYRTPYSFSKAFSARFGTTPGAYRSRFQADQDA
jgi:AraC-like DNA-binding protein